jgi:hypothetical protein
MHQRSSNWRACVSSRSLVVVRVSLLVQMGIDPCPRRRGMLVWHSSPLLTRLGAAPLFFSIRRLPCSAPPPLLPVWLAPMSHPPPRRAIPQLCSHQSTRSRPSSPLPCFALLSHASNGGREAQGSGGVRSHVIVELGLGSPAAPGKADQMGWGTQMDARMGPTHPPSLSPAPASTSSVLLRRAPRCHQ